MVTKHLKKVNNKPSCCWNSRSCCVGNFGGDSL